MAKICGPGSSVGPGDDIMGGDGYHNPAYGVGDIPGGTFVGLDRFHAACSIPNENNPGNPIYVLRDGWCSVQGSRATCYRLYRGWVNYQ